MALTPEDVVNKRFNPTKFREGYDQDEVDDFLDEVVVELRRLNQENDELRQRLVAGDSRVQELQRQLHQAQQAAATRPEEMPQQQMPQPPMPAAAPEPAVASQGFDPAAMDPGNTNNLLQLARRLHEEHVREGMEKRDQLIAEGHAAAARMVSEAEQSQREQLGRLERERQDLERKVDELRSFEREYRAKLKGYIQEQLRELETSSALPGGSQPAVTAGPAERSAPPEYEVAAAEQPVPPQYEPAPVQQPHYQPTGAAYPAPQQGYQGYPAEYPGFAPGN